MKRRMPIERRQGSIVPLVAVSLIALIGCVALAIDIGLFAEARTCLQDAVDSAVLTGVRQMNTNVANPNVRATTIATTIVTSNTVVGKNVAAGNITNLQAGVYRYSSSSKSFSTVWTAPNAGENYSALTMTLQYNQPTVFARVFGITQQQITVNATAVHRPRDDAIVLDFSGSMTFGCLHNNYYYNIDGGGGSSIQSQNVDAAFPLMGPYSIFAADNPLSSPGSPSSPMQNTTMLSDGAYTYAPSNITFPTVNHGPPILHDFASLFGGDYNAAAWANDIPGYPSSPDVPFQPQATAPAAGGPYYPGLYSPLILTYNPLKTTNPSVMPAPVELYNQNDPNWKYTKNANNIWESVLGDKFPYKVTVGSLPGAPGAPIPANYATTVHQFLSALNTTSMANVQSTLPFGHVPATITSDNSAAPGTAGAWWEYGCNSSGTTNTPPSTTAQQQANNGGYSLGSTVTGNNPSISFAGYSMGPGAYGKTFYMWPPDPRTPVNAITGNATPAAGESPATAWARGYRPGDWRQRFFNVADNSKLWKTSNSRWQGGSGTTTPNYNAILAWISGGPQVFPQDLRCGRSVFYTAIPTSIPSGNANNDLFWQNYINWVLAYGSYASDFGNGAGSQYLYGTNLGTNWNGGTSYGSLAITGRPAASGSPSAQVSMTYTDMPMHPRAHFWFGPLTMIAFMQHYIGGFGGNGGIMPGTCKEAQSWELKTAVQSALTDIQNNHPNDFTTVCFFSSDVSAYDSPKYPLGNDYVAAQLLLWFPQTINGMSPKQYISDPTQTIVPFDSGFNSLTGNNTGLFPTAHGGTAYAEGLQVAYNQFSANSSASGGGLGRVGANKLVIFETDGVPNTLSSGNFSAAGPTNSYYTGIGTSGGGDNGTGASAITVIQNMTSSTVGWGNRCQVHCVGFGDLLEPAAPAGPRATATQILSNMQGAGNTQNPIENYKIITGPFQTRIQNLQTAFQRIMEGSIQISLIQ